MEIVHAYSLSHARMRVQCDNCLLVGFETKSHWCKIHSGSSKLESALLTIIWFFFKKCLLHLHLIQPSVTEWRFLYNKIDDSVKHTAIQFGSSSKLLGWFKYVKRKRQSIIIFHLKIIFACREIYLPVIHVWPIIHTTQIFHLKSKR